MSHSRAGAGDIVSPFFNVDTQLNLMRLKLARIPPSIKSMYPVKEDHLEWDGVSFSWITKGGIELKPEDQIGEDCWSWAFYRGHRYFTMINGLQGFQLLDHSTFRHGLPKTHLNFDGAIDNIESVKSYLIDNNHVSDMIVYRRQLENYQDPGFEDVIEKLLIEAPVVVSFDAFPSYQSSRFRPYGIYTPSVMECQTTAYEIYPKHPVVITGLGAIQVNGEEKKFWEIQNSKGESWGSFGFDFLARGMGLVREAVEFKF